MTAIPSFQAVVHPEVEYSDSESVYLQPLVFTICFPGPVPRRLIQNDMPIEISVSLSEKYHGFSPPEVRTGAWAVNEDADRPISITSSNMDTKTNDDIPIPFLPLPSIWDPMNSCHWMGLMREIEQWLVVDVRVTTVPEWGWGRDTFWLAFIGAYPFFPGDRWEPWNPTIPLEGHFIEDWLTRDGPPLDPTATLSFIWDEFCRHVSLFYPFPLVAG